MSLELRRKDLGIWQHDGAEPAEPAADGAEPEFVSMGRGHSDFSVTGIDCP